MTILKRFVPHLSLALGLFCSGAGSATTLSIDGSEARSQQVNPHIYGINIANWCQHYYLKLCEPMLTNAGVTIVRFGATNIERYNWRNNRMYNVISKENQFVPTSWDAFVEWVRGDLGADVFLQVPVFGHVATDYGSVGYSMTQTLDEVTAWVQAAGTNVAVWGVGNEPFIAWKLEGYHGSRGEGADAESYAYHDGAHGDQIYNEDMAADYFFPRFLDVAAAIRAGHADARIVGPTPANWWLFWSTDYSPFCPATHDHPGDHKDDSGWYTMASAINQWDPRVFPDRGGNPSVVGWERNEETGAFNDQRNINRFVRRVGEYNAQHGGNICDYLDFHRYMNCDQDAVAVQEVRGLWDPEYASYDKETGASGTRTKLLKRFQNIIDHYNPGMKMSLSEYDYFYWQGHPEDPQVAALGQVDFLGTFARNGIQLACNWYIGEPDQSGGDYHNAVDSAKQAMFNEQGQPNPKYWAFKLMSLNFRDRALMAESSDDSAFSVYAGLDTGPSQLVVAAHYKGLYHPWWHEDNPGGFIEGQGASNATIVVSNFTITGVQSVHRFGRNDPGIMHLETGSVSLEEDRFTYSFEPLAVYLFRLHGQVTPPPEESPETCLHVYPARLDFGPYDTGAELVPVEDHDHVIIGFSTNFTHALKISNVRSGGTSWTISESCDWLKIVDGAVGTARVTDVVHLMITNKQAFGTGVYSTDVTVATSEGTVLVPVTMEVLPGEAGGELRLFDAETHSLAHTWGAAEPYSLGFYDGHGNTEDRNPPYIYTFSMDLNESSPLGGLASLRVDFDRSAGDNSAGRLYTAFGTYGHYDRTMCWVPTNANPSNYVFKFDIKTRTEGTGFTKTRLLVVITDDTAQTNKGKPDVFIDDFKQSMEIEDGVWQTVAIPLGGNFFDWKYPGGQDGRLVELDLSRIRQVEFCPWVGHENRKGVMWLDNLRIETADAGGNRYPVAVATQGRKLIGNTDTVQLSATNSHDPDGSVTAYEWSPGAGLSATNAATVTFTPPGAGVFTFDLVVTDDAGLRSRNPAQVVIKVIPTLVGTSIELFRDEAMTDPVIGIASDCLDVYVRLSCSAGGVPEERDFTVARVETDDAYGPDSHNGTDAIDIILEETGPDTKVFTGHFRLAAFSDELEERIGASPGSMVTVSDAGVSASVTVGSQAYGHEMIVDHIERGDGALNNLEGAWYLYDDNYNANTSVVYMVTTHDGAYAGSTESMHAWGTLKLGPTGSVDQLFAGVATKLTYLTEQTTNAVYDLGSTTGVKGISFWLKGNGTRLSVVLRSMIISNYDDYLYTIDYTPSNGWRQYQLLFTDFQQEGWGQEAVERETALRYVNSVQFKFASKINNETNQVWIDDVALFGGRISYASNVVYRKDNLVSMEGFGGMVLANPSFTNAGSGSATIHGWTLAGNVRGEDWGSNGGDAVFAWWNGAGGNIGQVIDGIVAGRQYRFLVDMTRSADYDGELYLDLVWQTAGGAAISTNSTPDIAPDVTTADWPFSSHGTDLVEAPAHAARVLVRIRSAGVGAGNAKAHDAQVVSELLPDHAWQAWVDGFSVAYTNDAAEGDAAAVLASTSTDWVAGMLVPDVWQTPAQHMTNFASFDGLAIKARRAPGFGEPGSTHARIRLGVVTGETEVARTRWMPVDAGEWRDTTLFPKERFYTIATADAPDLGDCVVWSNDWRSVDRLYIYYGPDTNGFTPCRIFVDDFRPYVEADSQ